MTSIKVGIVGAGAIAHEHCTSINRHPHAQVIANADLSDIRREAFASKYDIPRTYTTAAQLIADPELDAVSIAVPNVFHAPLANLALQSGKHVMLEKPFARNLREAQAVARIARRSGKVLMVGMNKRFCRDSQIVKALIDRGDLGEVYHAKTTWMRRSGIPKLGTWFCRKDMAGGGVLLDIGVHMLDLCLFLLGNFRAEAVSGATYGKFGHRGLGEGDWGQSDRGEMKFDVEDFATALVKLKGGASVALDVSWAMHQKPLSQEQVQIFGTEAGAAVYPHAQVFCPQSGGSYAIVEPQQVPLAFPACCRFANWIDAILEAAPPLCVLDQSLAVQMVIDAIYESAATGKEIRIAKERIGE